MSTETTTPHNIIRIAAVVLRREDGLILSVRKKNTSKFMMPGGKREEGETGIITARREIAEELGLELSETDLIPLGRHSAPAANEPGCRVDCDVFLWTGRLAQAPAVQAEIVESRWYPVDSQAEELAPLSREVIFPIVAQRLHASAKTQST